MGRSESYTPMPNDQKKSETKSSCRLRSVRAAMQPPLYHGAPLQPFGRYPEPEDLVTGVAHGGFDGALGTRAGEDQDASATAGAARLATDPAASPGYGQDFLDRRRRHACGQPSSVARLLGPQLAHGIPEPRLNRQAPGPGHLARPLQPLS